MKSGLKAHIAAKHTDKLPIASNHTTAPPLIAPRRPVIQINLSDLQIRIEKLRALADEFRNAVTAIQNELRDLKNKSIAKTMTTDSNLAVHIDSPKSGE